MKKMKSDQPLSLCPLQGCAPAAVLAEPQSYKQRRKSCCCCLLLWFLPQNPSQRGRADPSHSLQPHCGITSHCCLLCSTSWAGLCNLCPFSCSHCDTHCVWEWQAWSCGNLSTGGRKREIHVRESDRSKELLPELFVMMSSTIIVRNTSNKY